ncbi:MAG: GNAT family N-acetyltransferase [Candidatus Methanomethylicaceae archaeon]
MVIKVASGSIKVDLNGQEAVLRFHVSKGKMYIDSTFTPKECRGKGIGTLMIEAAIKYVREKGLLIVPVCQFSVEYFKRHSEYKEMLG